MNVERRLVGDCRTAALRTTATAVSVLAVLVVLQVDPAAAVLDRLGGGVGIGNLIVTIPAGVLALAGYHAYRHDGLLVCVAVAHLVSAAWFLPIFVWGVPGFETDPRRLLGVFVTWSLLIGGLGYALGRLVAGTVAGPLVAGSR